MLYFLENRLVFHPVRASEEWDPAPNPRVEEVSFQSTDGNRICAWWCPTPGWSAEKGAMLYCYGNAGNLSGRGPAIANWQSHLDTSILIFDYPGYGRSEGRPSEAGCYAAAEAGYEWLITQKHVPAERILLYGDSLGGGVAVNLASQRPHRALILVRTFTSIPAAAKDVYPWLPTHWLMRNKFDNLAKIGDCRRPVFVAHGSHDRVVGFAHGKRLFESAAEPKRFLEMPGADHNDPLRPEFFTSLGAFLAEHPAGEPLRAPVTVRQN